MNNIDRRDAEMPYMSDSSVMEEQRITRRLVQELNTSDRGDFENIKRILFIDYISKFGNLDKMENIIPWEI